MQSRLGRRLSGTARSALSWTMNLPHLIISCVSCAMKKAMSIRRISAAKAAAPLFYAKIAAPDPAVVERPVFLNRQQRDAAAARRAGAD